MQKEEWKDVKGFEGHFKISNNGVVLSSYRGWNRLVSSTNHKGYEIVSLRRVGYKRLTTSVHRLVALHFVENENNKKTVNHIDSNKLNNHYLNLEWCTNHENILHSWANGKRTNCRLAGIRNGLKNKGRINKGNLVLNTETGIYYKCLTEAWLSTNRKRSIGGFKWAVSNNKHRVLQFKNV